MSSGQSFSKGIDSLQGIGLIILACTLWAIDTLVRYPLVQEGISSVSIVFLEHFILTFIIFTVFFKSSIRAFPRSLNDFFAMFMVGGLGSAVATVAFTRAFHFLNPSLVILLQKFQPLVAIAMARFVLGERVDKKFIFWAMICLLGGILISSEDFIGLKNQISHWRDLFNQENAIIGYCLVFLSIFGWGSATVFGKKLGNNGYSDEQIMAARFGMGLLLMIPFVFIEKQSLLYEIQIYGRISLMVLVSGLLAMYLFYQGLRKISARACSLAEMFFPFMAVIINWMFLGASLSVIQLIGGGLLLLGSVIIQLKHY